MKANFLLILFLLSVIATAIGSNRCLPEHWRWQSVPVQPRLPLFEDGEQIPLMSADEVLVPMQRSLGIPELPTLREPLNIQEQQLPEVAVPQRFTHPDPAPSIFPKLRTFQVQIHISESQRVSKALMETLALLSKGARPNCENTEAVDFIFK